MAQIPCNEIRRDTRREDATLIAALSDFIRAQMRQQGVIGLNLALARRGDVIWEAGFGYADGATGAQQTPETVFHSGSMGKTYTGVAIMQLVESGVVALEDSVSQHVGFKVCNPLSNTEPTIWNLMTHTAGFGGDAAGCTFAKPIPLEDALRRALGRDVQPMFGGQPTWTHKPGATRFYSNIGIALLGLIVQKANPDGLSYSDYVGSHIIDRLGMRLTQYPPAQHVDEVRPDIWQRMSAGYFPLGTEHIPAATVYFDEFPAGGFLAPPADHLRLLLAMANGGQHDGGRILEAATVEQMLTQQIDSQVFNEPSQPRDRQGLIWWLRDVDDMNRRRPGWGFHHSGGHMWGWRTRGISWPGLDAACVLATNQWSPVQTSLQLEAIDGFIHNWLMTTTPAAEPIEGQEKEALSYLLGLLYVSAFKDIGCEPLAETELRRLVAQRVRVPWVEMALPELSEKSFFEGAAAIANSDPTPDGYRQFFETAAAKISLDDAITLYEKLTGHLPGMGSLLGVLIRSK